MTFSSKAHSHLTDVITLQRGFDLPEVERRDGPIPVVASTGVVGFHAEKKVDGPGVVIGRSGSIGGGQYIAEDFWPLNTTLWVRDFKGHNPRFIYYLLRTIDFSPFNAGAGVPTLNRNHLNSINVPVFKPNQEHRIANILSSYDDLIENNRRRMALLEETARQLYREWFVRLRFPGYEHTRITRGLPEGWERQRIGNIAECVGGGTPSTYVSAFWEDGNITWVTPTDVTRNRHLVLLDSEKKITEAGLQRNSAKLVPPHAVLMTSRASVGFFAVAGREVCTNQGFISIVPKEKNLSSYLLFHLNERVDEIRAIGSGSTYPEVSRGKFRDFEVLLPQPTLVSAFDEQATRLLQQIRNLKMQDHKLGAARDALLPRLMSGEITV